MFGAVIITVVKTVDSADSATGYDKHCCECWSPVIDQKINHEGDRSEKGLKEGSVSINKTSLTHTLNNQSIQVRNKYNSNVEIS